MAIHARYLDDRNAAAPSGWLTSRRRARRAGVDGATARAALRGMNRVAGAHGVRMGLFFALAFPVLFLMPFGLSWPWTLLVAAVLGAAVGLATRPFVRPRQLEALRAGWLARGRCPACGTAIAQVEPEEDGCRVCPECGCAWRIDEGTAQAES